MIHYVTAVVVTVLAIGVVVADELKRKRAARQWLMRNKL